jgi:hypothetical protein
MSHHLVRSAECALPAGAPARGDGHEEPAVLQPVTPETPRCPLDLAEHITEPS